MPVWKSSRRTALRGGRSRSAGKAKGQVDFRKPVVKSTAKDGLDPEVISWMYKIESSGGKVDSNTINALNGWVKKINSKLGLRPKLKRVNLFCGDNLFSSLIPIIADAGPSSDTNFNFAEGDYLETGASAGLKDRAPVQGVSKYIDTGLNFTNSGLTFNNGHFAVNGMGPSLEGSYKEWAGRSWASIGSFMSSATYHFRWGNSFVEIPHVNPQAGPSTGFYLGSVDSTNLSVYQNGNKTSSVNIGSVNNDPNVADKNFFIFKRNSDSVHGSFDQCVNFYSIGSSLTEEDSKFLYNSVLEFNQALKREYFTAKDPEVWEWANHRLNEVVGDVSTYFRQSSVRIADEWMIAVKNSETRNRIFRANLFLGGITSPYGYLTSFVPLIIDQGKRTDTNYNFTQKDFQINKGLKGDGLYKYVDIGISANNIFSDFEGHLSVNTTSETLNTSSTNSIGIIGVIGNRFDPVNLTSVNINLSKSVSGSSYGLNSYFGQKTSASIVDSSVGFFILNATNQTQFVNVLKGKTISQNSETNNWNSANLRQLSIDANINLFSSKSLDGVRKFSDQSISFYSVGGSLSGQQITALNGATEKLNVALNLFEASDQEVLDWANIRVPENGGILSQEEVSALNEWMVAIKSTSGLRAKLKRVNFNLGVNNGSKLVPIIKDNGHGLDESLALANLSDTTIGSYTYNISESNSYQLGNEMSSADLLALGQAFNTLKDKLGRNLDSEVYDWAYNRVPNNGGELDRKTVNAVDLFMRALKAETGLREKIIRLNLFAGKDMKSVSIPLIADGLGAKKVDVNYNFTSLSLDQGLQGGTGSYLDTTINQSHLSGLMSAADAHIMVGIKGGLDTKSNSFAISNGILKLNITSSRTKFHHGYANTSSLTENINDVPKAGIIIGSKIGSVANLYRDGSSLAQGDDGGAVDVGSGNFLIFADGSISSFLGRMSAYSLGKGLSASQVLALTNALKNLDRALQRGHHKASDPEVWDWANVRVPANGGLISQKQVDAANKWMQGVKSIYNLRQSIKRCNLFVGSNLGAALVPVIKDFGPDADTGEGFIESDFIISGVSAGLRTSGGKTLNTHVEAEKVLTKNYNMSFRSLDSYSQVDVSMPVMGAIRDREARAFFNDHGSTSFVHGTDTFENIPISSKDNYIAGYIKYPSDVVGVSSTHASKRPAPIYLSKVINNDSIDTVPGWTRFELGDLDVTAVGNAWYGQTKASGGRGLYTIKSSEIYGQSNKAKIKIYLDGKEKLASEAFDLSSDAPLGTIRLFGVSSKGEPYPNESKMTINFYCFGLGPVEPSVNLADVLDSNFLPDKMNKLLVDLDCDLGRVRYSLTSVANNLDPEVGFWANEAVPTYGGYLLDSHVEAVNAWMGIIRAKPGLRERLTRVNLFVGNNLSAALVPIIRDAGSPTDLNKGIDQFKESDYNSLIGLSPNISLSLIGVPLKFIDTGIKATAASKLSRISGHVSIASSHAGKKLFATNSDKDHIPISLLPQVGSIASQSGIWFQFKSSSHLSYGVWSNLTDPLFTVRTQFEIGPNRLITMVKDLNYKSYGSSAIISYVEGLPTLYSERATSEEQELPLDSSMNLFARSFGHDPKDNQGAFVPHKYYQASSSGTILALTQKTYAINEIYNKSKEELVDMIRNDVGDGWEIADWNDFSIFDQSQLALILNEFNIYNPSEEYLTVPEKPIGFVLSGGATYSNGQYLAHWLNKKILQNYSYSLQPNKQYHDNYWALRQTQYGDSIQSAAPIIIKNSSMKKLESYSDTVPTWEQSISYYSVGEALSSEEVLVMQNAYKVFVEKIGRNRNINNEDRFLPY